MQTFRIRKFWIPCKYFRLNAFWLTLLAVTAKLPFDYSIFLTGVDDKLARCSSLLLFSTAVGNFLTSLGSMEGYELILNLSALSVLVLIVAGSQFLPLLQIRHFWGKLYLVAKQITATVLMFPLLATLCSAGIMIPAARRSIDFKYQQMRKTIIVGQFSRHELKMAVKKYWVMAETGSLQFVIARSVTSVTTSVLCLLMSSIFFEANIRLHNVYKNVEETASVYKSSTKWILFTQCIGVVFGNTTLLLRLYMTARFKSSKIGSESSRDEFMVENYWTQMLVEWRESLLPLQIRHKKIRKLVHDTKELF